MQKKAVSQQGASIVVFEFEKDSKKVHEEIDKLKKMYRIHGLYFFSNRKHKIYEF